MKNRGFEIVRKDELDKYNVCLSDVLLPSRSTKYAAGYDFYSPVELSIKPNETVLVPTCVKAYMKEFEFLGIYIRSSFAIKYNLSLKNQVGIIDKDYYSNISNDGHILISIKNNSNEDFVIKKGDKVAQGIFQQYLLVDDDSCTTSRTGGIGSTGK